MDKGAKVDWYPGLMTRTKRFLGRHAGSLDVCLEIVDARAPITSRWHGLAAMLPGVPRILLLNKADLADPQVSAAWLERLKSQDATTSAVITISSIGGRRAASTVKQEIAKAIVRPSGARRPVKAAAVGVPNVGKSSVLNLLAGSRRAPAGAKPGLTRGEHWLVVSSDLWLLDLPGVLPPITRNAQDVAKLAALGTLPDGAYEQVDAALDLLCIVLPAVGPERLATMIGLAAPAQPDGWLEAFGRRRGLLSPGGAVDIGRAAAVFIAEYRRGVFGRLSLEHPPANDDDDDCQGS